MEQNQETDEDLCIRLKLDVNDWLYAEASKLLLLPLGITSKIYLDTHFEPMKIIFNAKVDDYDKKHKKYNK